MGFKQKDRIYLYYRRRQIDSFKKRAIFLLPILIFFIYFINNFIVFYIIVDDNSMQPNIKRGERIQFSRLDISVRPPFTRNQPTEKTSIDLKRGAIIAFENPNSIAVNSFLQILDIPLSIITLGMIDLAPRQISVKRTIGLPGENLKIIDKQIYLNQKRFDPGNKWRILYQDDNVFPDTVSSRDNADEIFIPNGYVYVLSDNWDYFNDSRMHGLVPFYKIEGIATDNY